MDFILNLEGVCSAVHICLADVYSRARHISVAAPNLEETTTLYVYLKKTRHPTEFQSGISCMWLILEYQMYMCSNLWPMLIYTIVFNEYAPSCI